MTKILSLREIQRKYSEPTEAQNYIGTRGMLGKLANPNFSIQMNNNIVMTHGVGSIVFQRNCKATYTDIYGRVRIAQFDEPRFQSQGLLIENESSINKIPYSQELQRWTQSRVTIETDDESILAPDGTATADSLKMNSDNNQEHYVERTFSGSLALTSNTDVTFSVFARADRFTNLKIVSYNKANTEYHCYYDLVGRTATPATLDTDDLKVSITGLSNSWARLSYTFNTGTGGTTPGIRIYLSNASNETIINVGDYSSGDSLFIWGAQLEEKGYMSSYIPTLASPVTRESDICFAPFEYNFPSVTGNSVSVVMDFSYLPSSAADTYPFLTALNNSYIGIGIHNSSENYSWWDTGKQLFGVFSTLLSETYDFGYLDDLDTSVKHRFALVYDNPTNKLYSSIDNHKFSDALTVSDVPALPDNLSNVRLEIGSSGFNGHISGIRIYDSALTEAEMGNI
jgi:hypothetical protein